MAEDFPDLEERFPHLAQFLGAYFHPEWQTEHQQPVRAVAAYMAEALPQEVAATLDELQQLMRTCPGEAELSRALHRGLGCYFNPLAQGRTIAEWLQWLEEELATAVRASW